MRWEPKTPVSIWRPAISAPLFGGLIGVAGYPVAFAVCALFPLVAIPIVPVDRAGNHLRKHRTT